MSARSRCRQPRMPRILAKQDARRIGARRRPWTLGAGSGYAWPAMDGNAKLGHRFARLGRFTSLQWCACLLGTILSGIVLSASAASAQPDLGGASNHPAAGADPLFEELPAASGLDFVHFNGMSGEHYLLEITGGGAALVDYDRDGDLDVFLVQGEMLAGKPLARATFAPKHPLPLTDRLYRNDTPQEGPPRFVDVTEPSGIPPGGYGMGVAAADYDGDGWTDLYITNYGQNRMLRNRGDGTFEDATERTGTGEPRWSVAAAFVDFDRDGHLDLFVGNYLDFHFALHKECPSSTGAPGYCGPLAYQPVTDRMFRNRGDGTFEDVSASTGIGSEAGTGGTLGAVAADFNGDGWADLYVAHDMLPNRLWINREGRLFEDEALFSGSAVNGTGLPEASMGVAAGDPDDDGDEDLFLAHLRGETNTFFANDGTGLFRDETVRFGLAGPSLKQTSFGAAFVDFDGDGDLDLATANGAVRILESLARLGDPFPLHQTNQLFERSEAGTYRDVSAAGGPDWLRSEVSRGLATGDLDNDGGVDLVVANNGGPVRAFRSAAPPQCWLGVRALDARAGSDVHGSLVRLTSAPSIGQPAGRSRQRRIHSDGSYASASDPRVLIAQPCNERPSALTIAWPGGGRLELDDPPTRSYLTFVRGQPASGPRRQDQPESSRGSAQ